MPNPNPKTDQLISPNQPLPGGTVRKMVTLSGELLERVDVERDDMPLSQVIREGLELWLKAR